MKINLKNETKEAIIEYKNRKTLAVAIDSQGIITIKAPNKMTEDEILKLLEPMIPRIEKRLENLEKNREIYKRGSLNTEDKFKLFGEYKNLPEFSIAKEDLEKFYRKELQGYLKISLNKYAKILGVKYKNFRINNVKTSWGTCNSKKELTFNVKLAMAPFDVIDYVVLHELCHIVHMNHDRSFWNLVGKIMPDYKLKKDYLSKFGPFMQI